MNIGFRNKKLHRCCLSLKEGTREWGPAVARSYIQRIELLRNVRSMDDLRQFPSLRCHPLRGDRRGEYAIDLIGRYRLIFVVEGGDPPAVCIQKVSKHYED
jgi:proteic killer suppression protein